jgi:hypothetical protein
MVPETIFELLVNNSVVEFIHLKASSRPTFCDTIKFNYCKYASNAIKKLLSTFKENELSEEGKA